MSTKMLASEMSKLLLVGTGRRVAFTLVSPGGAMQRLSGVFTGKSIAGCWDNFRDDHGTLHALPWQTPEALDQVMTDCEVDAPQPEGIGGFK